MADGNITVEVSTQAAQAELERLRADAERFRWLAEHTVATGLARWVHPFQFLDEAVDRHIATDMANAEASERARSA